MNGAAQGEPLEDQITPVRSRPHTDSSTLSDNEINECWSQRNLLSLDGGGIRGYWTLLVLKRLMFAIGEEERKQGRGINCSNSFEPEPFPEYVTQHGQHEQHVRDSSAQQSDENFSNDTGRFLPCHYFDIICGSSTGSLIAIMLCKFRMPVIDCIDEYKRMSHRIFGRPRPISQRNIGIVRWPKYKASAMEIAFQEVTQRRCHRVRPGQHPAITAQFPTVRGACAMFATTWLRTKGPNGSSKKLYLIRSYDHEKRKDKPNRGHIRNFGPAEKMDVWQVARAATAAPMYFTELEHRFTAQDPTTKSFFSDGGFGTTNNPTALGIQEVELAFGDAKKGKDKAIGVILSIGTARADTDPGKKSIFHRIKQGFDTATDPKWVADWVNYLERPNCWRLNDEKGLDLELDNWKPNGLFTSKAECGQKTLAEIEGSFNQWALDRPNQTMINKCAEQLVWRRRARTRDKHRWYRFATGASPFSCRGDDCVHSCGSRQAFDEHWRKIHEDHEHADRCREPLFTVWEYPHPGR